MKFEELFKQHDKALAELQHLKAERGEILSEKVPFVNPWGTINYSLIKSVAGFCKWSVTTLTISISYIMPCWTSASLKILCICVLVCSKWLVQHKQFPRYKNGFILIEHIWERTNVFLFRIDKHFYSLLFTRYALKCTQIYLISAFVKAMLYQEVKMLQEKLSSGEKLWESMEHKVFKLKKIVSDVNETEVMAWETNFFFHTFWLIVMVS